MDQVYRGRILQGSFDLATKELTVTGIKNLTTQSIWGIEQLTEMLNELTYATKLNQESLVVTVRDGLPLVLNRDEIAQIYQDIHEIYSNLT